MEPGDDKQVSDVPLESKQPAPRRGNLAMSFMLFCIVSLVTGLTIWWIDHTKIKPDNRPAQWPHNSPPLDFHMPQTDYTRATEHMQKLADALLQYRDGPMGGCLRWPASIGELQAAGLLEKDFDTTGPLSHKPLAYQPHMPVGQDPERWVMCHDIEVGWMRSPTGYAVKGMRAAVVILGDGSVKVLKGEELEQYAGLNMQVNGAG